MYIYLAMLMLLIHCLQIGVDHERNLAESHNSGSTPSRLLSSKGHSTEMGSKTSLGTNHVILNLDSKNKTGLASGTSKRPLMSKDDDDPDHDGLSNSKRHCIHNSETGE